LLARSKRPAWLRVDRLLGEWGIPEDSPAGHYGEERAGTAEALAELIHHGGVEAGAVAGS